VKSVLLEFLSTEEKTLIFVIRQDWEEKNIADFEPLFFEADFNERDVIKCVEEIRGLYDEWSKHNYESEYLNNIKLEERTEFYNIGNKIFSDELMNAINGYDLIYFVPFSALHHLPLHAMRYKEVDIIDDFACSYLPSASVLQFVNKSKERPKEFKLKGIGVDFKQIDSLEFADEIYDLIDEKYFSNKSRDFIDKEVTKKVFFEKNEQYDILHCATHGFSSSNNPLNSSIILYFPSDLLKELQDRDIYYEIENNPKIKEYLVTVNDLISNLKTGFELVFMSACVTGENKNEAGDELIGLSRGLFYSGTKSMIVTLFNTFRDVSINEKTHIKFFYQYWIEEEKPKAKALQLYIKKIKNIKKFKHPFNWFSYILIGNPY